ncbi:MAG: hypothetical protein ACR2NH_01620 [Solirubrobacteraceae bacterium]
MSASDHRKGDPRYRGDDSLSPTNEPIEEHERGQLGSHSGESGGSDAREPFPYLVAATIVAFAAAAIVAGVAVGVQYAVPFVVLGAIIAAFVGINRARTLAETTDTPHGPERDEGADEDTDGGLPDFGFDQESSVGSTSELSGEQQESHADMEKSPGS